MVKALRIARWPGLLERPRARVTAAERDDFRERHRFWITGWECFAGQGAESHRGQHVRRSLVRADESELWVKAIDLDQVLMPIARADVVEYLGNEELLHLNAADQDVVAIVDSSHNVRPSDILTMVLPLDKLHLFDGETGLTLAPDIAAVAA